MGNFWQNGEDLGFRIICRKIVNRGNGVEMVCDEERMGKRIICTLFLSYEREKCNSMVQTMGLEMKGLRGVVKRMYPTCFLKAKRLQNGKYSF